MSEAYPLNTCPFPLNRPRRKGLLHARGFPGAWGAASSSRQPHRMERTSFSGKTVPACRIRGGGGAVLGRMGSPACPPRGATLAELMVAVAVIGILAAVAIPSLARLGSRSNLAREWAFMASRIALVRDLAIRNQEAWCVVFIPEGSRWYCHADPNSNRTPDRGEALMGPYVLSRGVSFGSSSALGPNNTSVPSDGVSLAANRISFSAMGTCNAGSVYLTTRKQDVSLRIFPASGTVVVYEREGALWRPVR